MWNNTTNSCKTTVVTFISTQVINNMPRFSWQTIQNEIQHTTGQLSNVTSYWAWSSAVCLQRKYQLAVAIIFNWQDLDPTPLSFSNRTLLHIMYLVSYCKGFPTITEGSHFIEVPIFRQAAEAKEDLFFQVVTCSGFPFLRALPLAEGSHFQEGCHLQRAPIFHRVATSRGISFFRGLPPAEGSHFWQGCHFANVPIF